MLRILIKSEESKCPELICSDYAYYDPNDSTLNFDRSEDTFVVGPITVEEAQEKLRALLALGYLDVSTFDCSVM